MAAPIPGPNVGFLAILQEPGGTLGGYLATNAWGRPLEFRLTSAVQPNRVQAILYGASLASFVASELIGKALIEKATTPVQWIVVDVPQALELRRHVDLPVVLQATSAPDDLVCIGKNLYTLPAFAGDADTVASLVEKSPSLDLAEPFLRVRDAVSEARKMGLAQRPAA